MRPITRLANTGVSCLFILLVFTNSLLACSWDYPIWQIHNKNADSLYRFIKGNKAGYIDQTGKIIVKPTLHFYGNYSGEFRDGLLLTGVSEGPYIDRTGKIVLDTKYERNWDFSDGLAVAMKEGEDKWGYIDRAGRFAISPRFETYPNGYVHDFSDGLAMIEIKKRYGYIDRSGEFVIEPKFLKGTYFTEGRAIVVADGPCIYFDYGPCSNTERLGNVKDDKNLSTCKLAFIDTNGEFISDERYDRAGNFSEGLAPVEINGKWGFIDKQGRMVIQPQFDDAEPFHDGLACVGQGKKWGYIDREGKLVIKPQFDAAEHFSDGLAPVGKWDTKLSKYTDYYFIDKTGKQAFPGIFNIASYFFKGLAHVKLKENRRDKDDYYLNGEYAYINTQGKVIFKYEYRPKDDD